MFDRYVAGKSEKYSKSKGIALAASALANSGILAAVIFSAFWKIERLHAKVVPVVFQSAAAPPPPPPAAPAIKAPQKVSAPRPIKPRELVQPVAKADPQPETPPTSEPTSNEPPSNEPTVVEGTPGGVGDGPGVPGIIPPVIEKPPVNVPITGVEAMRLSGTREIPLPPSVKAALVAQGKHRVNAVVKLCLDRRGEPDRVQVVGSTGFPEADDKIRDEVLAWRYRAYRVNGEPVPVCTAVVFKYEIE